MYGCVDFDKLIAKEQEIIEGLQDVAIDLNYAERYANAIKTHAEVIGVLREAQKAKNRGKASFS
jgi:hypothetical protein